MLHIPRPTKESLYIIQRDFDTYHNDSLFIIAFLVFLTLVIFIYLYISNQLYRNNYKHIFIEGLYSFWRITQFMYISLGLLNCFRVKNRSYILELHPRSHNLFYLTILYIIANLLIYEYYNHHNRSSNERTVDIVEIMALILTASAIPLTNYISSVSYICVTLFVFMSMQFGVYGNLINNYHHNNICNCNK